MNKVVLIGRLTKDPELKYTPSSVAVVRFTLAVDRNYVGQNGQKEADFIPVVCWRKTAEFVANNLGKGRLIAVSGSIQTGSYTAQDGTKRYTTDVVGDEVKVLEWPKDGGSGFRGAEEKLGGNENFNSGFFPVEGEDDIPF